MYDYRGITALVTGASKGLGRAYALELARRGADVVVLARSAESLDRVAEEIRSLHAVTVNTLVVDLSDARGPDAVVAQLRDRNLTVDLLLNNAGMASVGPFIDRPFEPNRQSVDLNITALMALTHAIGRDMVARGSGAVINVASTAAFQPMPYQASYAATKAFVLSFTEALAEELHGTGVRVMAAHPGTTLTGFFEGTSAVMNPKTTDAPEQVAAKTLDDFARGRAASYPGRASTRAYSWAARLLPRARVARITENMNRKAGFRDVVDRPPIA